MKRLGKLIAGILPVILFASGAMSDVALAHERRDVGTGYQLVVGWMVEPALEGQKNGVDIRVIRKDTTQPVEGVEKTLKVEITHIASGTSRIFNLRTIFRDPGHYTADLIVTAPGVYRMRFFGAIEATQVNETFSSRGAGGGFNDVESAADIQFPVRVAEVREIEAVARRLEQENRELNGRVATASGLAIAGVGLGALGAVAGTVSLITSRRKAK